MRRQLGILFAAFLYYSGLVALARRFMERSQKRLIILNYHRARSGNLEHHFRYLQRHYKVLHLEEALQELYAAGKNTLVPSEDKRTRVVLTFDDGYHDNYTHAFPLACSLRMPVTIFLVPGYLESGDYFWWGEGHRLVSRSSVEIVKVNGSTYDLYKPLEKQRLAEYIDTFVRLAASVAEREAFLKYMRELLAVPSTVTADEKYDRPLTWAEVQEMEQSGWVSFGAHTMHHPVLAYLKDEEEINYEIGECKRVLEAQLGHQIRTFAYPIGRFEHIGTAAIQAVRAAGYDWAVTTVNGACTNQDEPLLLKRLRAETTRHWLVMAAEAAGIWDLFSPLWKLVIKRIRTFLSHLRFLLKKGV